MKSEINLLSPEARTARMALVARHRLQSLLTALFALCMIVLIAYGASLEANIIIRNSLDTRLQEQGKNRSDVEKSISSLNVVIQAMDRRITTNPRWAIHIQELFAAVPTGIKVTKLELTENPEALVVTGKAINGDVVVQYQHALESLPWVDHVDAPLQNFAQSPDAIAVFTIVRKADNGGVL
ncbi:MAG: hypothetical protein K8Q97_01180 [Candidatus Andersenbacteria bacterium]|nr:hypothetical protein [Candidatus Andersenbacteria bacterium]